MKKHTLHVNRKWTSAIGDQIDAIFGTVCHGLVKVQRSRVTVDGKFSIDRRVWSHVDNYNNFTVGPPSSFVLYFKKKEDLAILLLSLDLEHE